MWFTLNMTKRNPLVKAEPITVTLDAYALEEMVERVVNQLVRVKTDAVIEAAVGEAVGALVQSVGQKRIAAEIEKTLSDGWQTVNSYGESNGGKRTLKDRIGDILNHSDRYGNSKRWLDMLVQTKVEEVLKTDFKADIEVAKAKFKSEVDSVLTNVIKKAVAEHFGVKQ